MTKRRPAGPQRQATALTAVQPTRFRAGCGREWELTSAEPDLAYTEQAFPECPLCRHRVEPEGGPPFCTLRPAATRHPFAALAGLILPE